MQQLQLVEGLHYKRVEAGEDKYEMLIEMSVDIHKYKRLSQLNIDHPYYSISNKTVIAKEGYRWDGPSGPTIDDETNLRASLFHDIIYQAMGEQSKIKRLSLWVRFFIRREADRLFKAMLKADGMPPFRRQMYFIAVRGVGAFFAHF
jgi:hypothetical protein